jgi:hypothetical protein
VVLVENSGHVGDLIESGLAGVDSTVFAPADDPTGDPGGAGAAGAMPARPLVVGYHGSAVDIGAELSLSDEFFLQIQAYGISEFMSVVGPTLVRVADGADFDAYLGDADRARSAGEFAAFMTNPVVQLADVSALGAGPAGDGPDVRLFVGADGAISTSAGGAAIGELGRSDSADLAAAWMSRQAASAAPCPVCLGSVLEEATRVAELRSRPWLGRYLAAAEALRVTTARGIADVRVSGFGGTLAPGLADVPPVDDDRAPLVLWNADTAFVYDPRGRRTFGMDHRTAQVLDVLITCGGVVAGRDHLAEAQLREGEMLLAGAGLSVPERRAAVVAR